MDSRILLRGGLVADGVGATARHADVLVEGHRITAMGVVSTSPGECEVVDLTPGSVVCPGFIDAHVHAEGPLLATGLVEGALAQGVTTLVVGQDGQSWVGANAATAQYLNQYFAPVNGRLEPARDLSVAGFRAAVTGRLCQNVAVLASQGTIRHNVAGMAVGPLQAAERDAARREVEQALADGAVGLSSGLDYLPSRFGMAEEVAEIARPLAAAGRPYVSHLRGYGPDVGAGLTELVSVGRDAGARVHASHLWGTPADLAAAFGAADGAGVALTFDMYPYQRSSTILASLLLPTEVQADGPQGTLAALRDPRQRAGLLAGERFTEDYLRNVYLACVPEDRASLAGRSVAEAAEPSGQTAGEWVLDLLADSGLDAGGHLHRPALTEADLAWLNSHERHCAGSDGIYQGQRPHPRGYATFARLAGQYVASSGPASDSADGDSPDGDSAAAWQSLARHLATTAADAYGLRDRGRLAPGMAADICVIAPSGLSATATYTDPRRNAAGVDLVLVNGVITWRDGHPVPAAHAGELVC
ncbi:MAG TPA: amidohydrolase family protein [Streptosporangiaceae bacterium]|nr:amidohydrolase family protein [Streptosporangiaceae bacterium]